MSKIKKTALIIIFSLFFVIIVCEVASAATINVNNSTGIQNAINMANPGDTLNLTAGTYKEHDISVYKNLTITGPQTIGINQPTAVIDAQNQGRVFIISTGSIVTLKYLLIQNGNATIDTINPSGGGIFNNGTLKIQNCSIQKNIADCGGGISNNDDSTLIITNSNVYDNIVTWRGGGIYTSPYSIMTMTDSNIYNNIAGNDHFGGFGGGIFNYQGDSTITNSNIYKNSADYGGGIYNNRATSIITGSNVYQNTADYGGGIYIFHPYPHFVTVKFCRISENSANQGTELYFNHGNLIISSSVHAQYNWWGSNNNPSNKIYGESYGYVNVTPWLILSLTANPTLIKNENTPNITADLCYDSSGGYHNPTSGCIPDGLLVSFSTTLGTINSPVSTVNGTAKSILSCNDLNGVVNVTANFDNQTVKKSLTIDTILPTVTSIDPANNAVNVARNKQIKIIFSEPVLWGNYWVELKNSNGTTINFTKSITGNVLTITPSALLTTGTKYKIYLHTGCVKDSAGNVLAGVTKSFTTTTDGVAPTLTSSDPTNNAVNVPRNKVIKITFSEPLKWGTFWIELKNSSGTIIPITKSITGNVLTITPSSLLATETKYTICLHTGCVMDYAGNQLTGIVKTFTTTNDSVAPTITSSDPVNKAVNVPINKQIKISFSEPLKWGTFWIELKNSTGTVIPITKSITGNVLTITPSSLLTANTKYTIALHTGCVTDYAGNPLVGVVRSFTTETT